jgi:periplasmic divalent cation tolerance protein
MTPYLVVLSTFPDQEQALGVARQLVEEKLVACVNVLPGATSVYVWQGALEQASEVVLLIKTHRDKLDALRERLTALHPYDVPELLALPVEQGNAPYLRWLKDALGM